MSQHVTVECPTCGYKWPVNLAEHKEDRTLHKGGEDSRKVTVKEYRFKCPKDGTFFIVPIEE